MLSDLKVLDLSTVLAGPSVGTFLAELGAKVIKIEHPQHKDVTRSWKLPVEDKEATVSAYFSSINYKKDYLSLDLTDESDKRSFLEMVKEADVVLSNFKRSDYEKFGIEDEKLLTLNPQIIIGKINGYGNESDRVAYDLILQAESGFMSINGTEDSGPVKMPVAVIDVLAAHHLKEAILLASLIRHPTT
jgi:crotonobetainyl-CoA:carnitine CoA-transferase CaiB-like acyl-CoA transferase